MAIVESVSRLISGVLSKRAATDLESFSKIDDKRILEHPHYTRPDTYEGMSVPEELKSGNHKTIKEFRRLNAQIHTKKNRPDLLKKSH